MNDNNFYVVHGWMMSKLKLKNKELSTFAIIYGFSQDGENVYNGGLSYLEEWTCSSKKTVIETLKKLVEKKYLIKTTKVINNITFNEYKANIDFINDVCKNYTSGVKITPTQCKNYTSPSVKITPNNINNNIDNNIYTGEGEKEAKDDKEANQNEERFNQFWAEYPKKRDKQASKKAFTKLHVDVKLFDKMMASLSQFKKSYDWQKNGGQFIPYPSTWLNGRRWEDELTTTSKPQAHREDKKENAINNTKDKFSWL